MKRWLLIFMLASPMMAQNNFRWDYQTFTTQASGGNYLPVYAIPGSTIRFFNYPALSPANTFNTQTATTPCAANVPVVLQGSTTCVGTADPQGNFGAWFQSGTYEASITPKNGGSYTYIFDVAGGGGGGTPASPNESIQYNNSGRFGATGWTFDPGTNIYGLTGSAIIYNGGGCSNPFLFGSEPCYFRNVTDIGSVTTSGAESDLLAQDQIYQGGPGSYTGFPGSGVNNSTSDLFSWAATFNKPGFKRVVEAGFPGLLFHSLGDGSVLNLDAHWVPGWCCASDEGWNMFRFNQEEEDSYGQGTINTVASTATNVPIAAGQGPFSPVPQTYNSEVVWNTGGLFTAYTGAKLVYLDGGSCGTLPFVPGTSTYFPGQVCGTFGGSATAFGSVGIGQIAVTVAHGTINPVTAYGLTSASFGDQTNQYTQNIPVATQVTVALQLLADGTTRAAFPTPNPANHFDQSNFVCVVGSRIETARVTSVGTAGSGNQTLVLNIRLPHPAGSAILQGDCGPSRNLILTPDANYANPSGYYSFGRWGGNLLYATERAQGIDYMDAFQLGTHPNNQAGTWSLGYSAIITSTNQLQNQPYDLNIEDNGLAQMLSHNSNVIVPPYTGRLSLMFQLNDRTTNFSNNRYQSGLVSLSFNGPGDSAGYEPFRLVNARECTTSTFLQCGGPFDPPIYMMSLEGEAASLIQMQEPSTSVSNPISSLFFVTPGDGAPAAQYNLFTLSVNGGTGGFKLGFDRVHGSIYTLAPANEGIFVSEINQIGFRDYFNHTNFASFNVGCPGGGVGSICVGDGTSDISNSGNLVGKNFSSIVNATGNSGVFLADGSAGGSPVLEAFLNLTKPSIGTNFLTLGTTGTGIAAASIVLGGTPSIAFSGDNVSNAMTINASNAVAFPLLSDGCAQIASHVLTSTGSACGSGGGGGVSGSGTIGFIPAWTGTTALGNSHIDDGITTAGVLTASEPFVVAGSAGSFAPLTFNANTAGISSGATNELAFGNGNINNATATLDAGALHLISTATGVLLVQSNNVSNTLIQLNNTSTGGHDWIFISNGQAESHPGSYTLLDGTSGWVPFIMDATSSSTGNWRLGAGLNLVFTNGSPDTGTIDTGITRTGAATLALGNGTAGNATGTLVLGSVQPANGFTGSAVSGVCTLTIVSGIITATSGC